MREQAQSEKKNYFCLGQLFLITWFTDLIFEKMGRSVEIKIKIKFHYTHYFNFV